MIPLVVAMSEIPIYENLGGSHEVRLPRDSRYVFRRTAMHNASGPYGYLVTDEVMAWLAENAPNAYRFKQCEGRWGVPHPWGVGVRFKDFNLALLFRIRFSE